MIKILYLGTDPSRYVTEHEIVHCPLIQVRPLPIPEEIRCSFDRFTHIILTSPNAARILMNQFTLDQKTVIAIGKGTAAIVQSAGWSVKAIAHPETQEGMIDLLENFPLQDAHLLYPRSSRARPLLALYLKDKGLTHTICDLYETDFIKPAKVPHLEDIEEIVFTSPSTVHAFVELYGKIPSDKKLTCLGPITQTTLQKIVSSLYPSFPKELNYDL